MHVGHSHTDPGEAETGAESDDADLSEESDEESVEACIDSRLLMYSANAEALPKLPSFLSLQEQEEKSEDSTGPDCDEGMIPIFQ